MKDKKAAALDRFLNEVGKYLKAEGWKVGVLGPTSIKQVGERAFNHDLIVQIVAKPPALKVKKVATKR